MMQQTMLELANPFDAFAKHLGHCLVKYMIIGSTSSNPQFLIRIYHSGLIRTVDQNDIIEYGNPTAGEKLQPVIPMEWYTTEMLAEINKENEGYKERPKDRYDIFGFSRWMDEQRNKRTFLWADVAIWSSEDTFEKLADMYLKEQFDKI